MSSPKLIPRESSSAAAAEQPVKWTASEGAELLDIISNAVPTLISYLTPDGRYKFCNRAYTDWFKVTLDEVVGRPVVEIVGESMWRASEPKFRRALEGHAVEYEVEANYALGPRRWVRVSYTPHRLASGAIAGVVAMISDITARKMAEEATRAAEERLQLAMSIADAGTWDFDLITNKLHWSNSHFRLLGLEPAPDGAASPDMWESRMPPDDLARLKEEWTRAERDHDRFLSEHRLRKNDGQFMWVRAAGRFMYDGEGRAMRFVGVFFDITAAKEAAVLLEETVRERTAALRVKLSELEAFSYSLSHDLRAPLRSMYGFTQVLLEDYAHQLDPDAQDFLRRIERGAQRLDQLVRDVLSYSRVAKEQYTLTPIDLSTIVTDVVHSLEVKPAELHVEMPLPVVLGHGALLSQIFSNLIDNAVKFARPDQPSVVRVYARAGEKTVRIFVEDHGIGIAPKDFDRIFEIFGRIHSDIEYPGTGIGLAVVRKAVERLGGKVGVESQLGQGARFWVELQAVGVGA